MRIYKGFYCFLISILFACSNNNEKAVSLESESNYGLNDTGILYGGDFPLGVNDSCSGRVNPEHEWAQQGSFTQLTFIGQDCESGRDTQYPDDRNGYAGFAYQKISSEGKVLNHESSEWLCVKDTVTGLMWERKSEGNGISGDGGLHDPDDRFSWYSNDWGINAGHVGSWGRQNDVCSGYVDGSPSTYCNTESFIERVNTSLLCSYGDWRLPSVSELSSLIHYGATEPSIDVTFFPNTQNAPFWSASPISTTNTQARYVNFRFGQIIWAMREEPYRVRLVRGGRNE